MRGFFCPEAGEDGLRLGSGCPIDSAVAAGSTQKVVCEQGFRTAACIASGGEVQWSPADVAERPEVERQAGRAAMCPAVGDERGRSCAGRRTCFRNCGVIAASRPDLRFWLASSAGVVAIGYQRSVVPLDGAESVEGGVQDRLAVAICPGDLGDRCDQVEDLLDSEVGVDFA